MRLWHQMLLSYLPNAQLLGQHRELCALRGLGFGRKHRIVDYVFQHPYSDLYHFHLLVMKEMKRRGFIVNSLWENIHFRGKRIGMDFSSFTTEYPSHIIIYKEHNYTYFIECIRNLKEKNIFPFS